MVEKIRPPIFQQAFQKTTFGLLNLLVEKGYKLQVNNLENLTELNNDHSSDPVVIYFNHISNDDPVIITTVLKQYLNKRHGPWIYPVSEHYTHFQNHKLYPPAVFLADTNATWPL